MRLALADCMQRSKAAVHIVRPAQVSCINTEHIEQAASWRSMGRLRLCGWWCSSLGSAQPQAHVRAGLYLTSSIMSPMVLSVARSCGLAISQSLSPLFLSRSLPYLTYLLCKAMSYA
jgi:hypothetical protein